MSDEVRVPFKFEGAPAAVVAVEQVEASLSALERRVLELGKQDRATRDSLTDLYDGFLRGKVSADQFRASLVGVTSEAVRTAEGVRRVAESQRAETQSAARAAEAAHRTATMDSWERLSIDAAASSGSAAASVNGLTASVEKASATSKAFTFNEMRQAVVSVYGDVTALASAVVDLSSEQSRLDANSARLGLDFNQAADAAGRFTDETEAMSSATRLAEAGIRLSQEQLDALTRVAGRFAQNTGVTTREAIDSLTQGLITGGARGLRPFGDELARSAGHSHTAAQRLAALTAQAAHTERATDDAASSMARLGDTVDDMKRTLASAFTQSISDTLALASAADTASTRFDILDSDIVSAGRSIGTVVVGAGNGIALVVGGVATAIAGMLSATVAGAEAAGAVVDRLRAGHVTGLGDAASRAFSASLADSPITSALARFTEGRANAAEAIYDRGLTGDQGATWGSREQRMADAATAAGAAAAERASGPAVSMAGAGARGGKGADRETQALMANARLVRDETVRERAELERLVEVRRRVIALQALGAETIGDELRARQQLEGLEMRAAERNRDLDERQLARLHEVTEALQARAQHLTGTKLTTAQHDVNELVGQELELRRRVEGAVHSIALANAQRYAAERRAMDAVAERERVEAAAEARRRAAFAAPTSQREHVLGRAETLDEQLARARENDAALNAARRAVGREDRATAQNNELAGVRDPAEQAFAIEEMRRAHTIERERDHLRQRYELNRDYTDRMEELHGSQFNSALALSEGVTGAFNSMGDAVANHIVLLAQDKEGFADAAQSIASETLASVSKQAVVKGAFEFAEGAAALAGVVTAPLAPGHFIAGAAYMGVAAAAGVGAAALAPSKPSVPSAAPRAESLDRPLGLGGSAANDNSRSAGTVYNINFNSQLYGLGGAREAARTVVRTINRGGLQGGVQLAPGALQATGSGS